MVRSPGLEVPDTTSPLEEPTSLPGVDLRCGSRTSLSHSPSSSDPPALMRDTLVCMGATEALTNGVNNNRATTKGISSKDTATTTHHTIRTNTRSNTLLLPLTKTLDKTPDANKQPILLSHLTPSNHNYLVQSNAHFFPDCPPPLSCSSNQPTTFSLVFSGASTVSYMVLLFGGLSERSQYTYGITFLFCIVADLLTAHERILS